MHLDLVDPGLDGRREGVGLGPSCDLDLELGVGRVDVQLAGPVGGQGERTSSPGAASTVAGAGVTFFPSTVTSSEHAVEADGDGVADGLTGSDGRSGWGSA